MGHNRLKMNVHEQDASNLYWKEIPTVFFMTGEFQLKSSMLPFSSHVTNLGVVINKELTTKKRTRGQSLQK